MYEIDTLIYGGLCDARFIKRIAQFVNTKSECDLEMYQYNSVWGYWLYCHDPGAPLQVWPALR